MTDNSIYAPLILARSLVRSEPDSICGVFYHLVSLPYSFQIHLMFIYLFVRLRLSSVHVHFVFVGSDLFYVESPGLSYFIQIES